MTQAAEIVAAEQNRNNALQPKKLASTEPLPHVGYLDGLRGLAVLGVLAVHCAASTSQVSRFSWPFFGGSAGVELFYAVSAFTLFLSMDARAGEWHETRNFLFRRFFRIAPLFYITIFLSWCRLQLPFVHGYRPTKTDYLLGALFLFGFKPATISSIVVGGWSIAVETTFYGFLPLLHARIRSVWGALLAFVVSYATLIPFSHYLGRRYPEYEGYFGIAWFPAQVPMFLMGILIYFTARKLLSSRSSTTLRCISVVLLAVSVTGFFLRHAHPVRLVEVDYPIDIFLVGGVLLSVALHPWVVLDNAVMRFIGKVSYSVYLLHFFVLEILLKVVPAITHSPNTFFGFEFGHLSSFFVLLAVLLAVSLVVANLSWRYIEQPGIALGRRLLKHFGQTRPPDPSVFLPGTSRCDDMTDAPL